MKTSKLPGTSALALSLAGALLTGTADSIAGPCDSEQPEAGVPVRVPCGPADFGMLPEACAATSVAVNGQMGLIIATEEYYGQLHAGGAVRGRFELPGGSWLSAQLPGLDYWYLVNATVEADSVELSASTLGWHLPLRLTDEIQVAPYVRVMMPSETIFETGHRWGFEHGVSAVASLHPMFELVGGYALPLLLTHNNGATHSVYMPTLTLDAGLRPWDWVEIAAGASLRIVPPDDEPFESFDPRVALRLYPWRGSFIDLAAAFPVGGRDRALVAAGASLGWVFDTANEPASEPSP